MIVDRFFITTISFVLAFLMLRAGGNDANALSPDIVGRVASVESGGSFHIDHRKIQLWGISAPSAGQMCFGMEGDQFACGERARLTLSSILAGHIVTCQQRTKIQEFGIIAACSVGGRDVGREMVSNGWAIAERRFEGYVPEENDARLATRGLWAPSQSQQASVRGPSPELLDR